MGYDLISAASLIIDSEHRRVWSRMTNSCVASETAALFLETEPVLTSAPCTLRGDAPPFQPCPAITVTPVTPSSFPGSEPYASPPADTYFFILLT